MKRPWFHCLIILSLCGLSSPSRADIADRAGSAIRHLLDGRTLNEAGPGRTMPGIDWTDYIPAIVDILPDVVDIFDRPSEDKEEQYREEQEAEQEQEAARRERERAQRAEQAAQQRREAAQRERQRAQRAEQAAQRQREEVSQSREMAEEARGTAQQAQGAAEEARGAAREAKGIAQDASGVAQEAKGAAQEAKGISQEAKGEAQAAKGTAEEARGVAHEAKGTAEQARGAAVEAQMQVEEAHLRVGQQNTFVALLALLTLLALILALRKPRQAIVRAAGNAIEPLSRRFKAAGHKPASGAGHAGTANVVLTGFDNKGRPVNIPLPESELNPDLGGFTLGRHHLLVDTVLDDERVSKRHARFSHNGRGYFVEDLNSRNGTVINGTQPCAPFKPMQIRPGDTVRLGGMELMVSA